MSERLSVSIKEPRTQVVEREPVEYTADSIREIWSNDTAETSLVLALLEKWEAAEIELRALRLTAAEREALSKLHAALSQCTWIEGAEWGDIKAALSVLSKLRGQGGAK